MLFYYPVYAVHSGVHGADLFHEPIGATGLRRLAQAVIIQAMREIQAGSQDAQEWITGPEADLWLDVADIESVAIQKWLATRKHKPIPKKGPGRPKAEATLSYWRE